SNFLHLHFYYPSEQETPNVQKRSLIVTYLLESDALEKPEIEFESIHDEITKTLQELMPFSDHKIELIFPKSKELPAGDLLFPLEASDYDVFKSNAAENPIYEAQAKAFQDLFPFPNRTFFYKNLILTGSEILSSLGLEGSFLLGLKTTDLVWSDFEGGKKKAIKQRKIA
ncbi:MAG: hypothetical protein JNK65_06435, partial [Deltaproteobacteria bacterium]|nr:hypothetical protein [Deltaproteobacteria bacterium]